MSKIVSALNKAGEAKAQFVAARDGEKKDLNAIKKKNNMRKSWFTWVIVAAAIVMALVLFNYQSGKDAVPLSEIFPDEEVAPVDVEYEFVQEEAAGEVQQTAAVPAAELKAPAVAGTDKVTAAPAAAIVETVLQETDAKFTVQIASFKDRKKAEEALTRILKNVPSAYLSEQNLGDKGTWYRIYAGRFNARSDAEISLNDIKRNYTDSFIISPKKAK